MYLLVVELVYLGAKLSFSLKKKKKFCKKYTYVRNFSLAFLFYLFLSILIELIYLTHVINNSENIGQMT